VPSENADVAIIGGGMAGLTAAHRLAKEGVSFRIYESAPRWGGLIHTERVDRFLLDAGPDTLLAHRPEAIALCRDLGLGDRLVPATPTTTPTFVAHHDRLHALPQGMQLGVPARFGPLVRTSLFSALGKLRMAADLAVRRRRDGSDESIASFFRRRLGAEALERLGEPLLAGIHAGDAERLSMRATFPSLVEMESRHGSIIRGLWAASRTAARANVFYSLPDGLGELVDALVLRLPPRALKLGCRLTAIERGGSGLTLHDVAGGRLRVRSVILAAPLWESARLLTSAAPAAAAALSPVRFASSATVFLAFRRRHVLHPLDGYGFVVPRGEHLRMRACTFSSTKYPGRAPDDCVLVKGYVGGDARPSILGESDAQLAGYIEHELRRLLDLRGAPVLSRVYRWVGASPQMDVGHAARMARLEASLRRTPDVIVIGAGLHGSGIPNAVSEGWRGSAQAMAMLGAEAECLAH
jgi:oxygen-dependent protoporphyrinogen oxidase